MPKIYQDPTNVVPKIIRDPTSVVTLNSKPNSDAAHLQVHKARMNVYGETR
jgi:hypothetical protein